MEIGVQPAISAGCYSFRVDQRFYGIMQPLASPEYNMGMSRLRIAEREVLGMNESGQKACVIFNKLIVTEVDNTSGIFIGTNQAIGWTSYSKSNQGFGNVADAAIMHSVNVIHDEDVIDASVRDTRYIALTEGFPNLQQGVIHFQSVNVNAVNNGSAINLGNNKQPGWRSSRKMNYGAGKHLGANRVNRVVNYTFDNDMVDAPSRTAGQIIDNSPDSVDGDIRILHTPKAADDGKPD